MGKRNKKYVPDKTESKAFGDQSLRFVDSFGKNRTDSFCMIWDSLMQSEAYIDLTPVQKNLYILCACQRFGHRKPGKDYDEDAFQGADKFYLNWREVNERYGMYSQGNHSRFYKDMKALEDHGFIKKLSSGKNHHTKSIYQYDSAWQFWEPEQH